MNTYSTIKKRFAAEQNKEKAVRMADYMQNRFRFYGIQTPLRRTLYKDFLNREKQRQQIDWPFLDQCYADEYREFQYLVLDYLTAMQKQLRYEHVANMLPYIKSKQWWDTIDGFDRIIGNIGLFDNRIDELMLKWSTDTDFWLRRLAIDHQLLRKEQTNTDLLAKILVNNLNSDEFFINKAIGWSLRDYSKTNPNWVSAFITEHKDKMDKLSLKEAGKYL
ncbi:MAG: DNA alkylation repair protein [Gammaproteobacteria bacterium]|nr:MAG: DNA alkylation repair protein [Gammaproteobacteria bacterium]